MNAPFIHEKTFDLAAIRSAFPVLTRSVHSRPLVYLDNAASAQKPNAVIDAMADYYRHSHANVHRGLHTLANEATTAYEDARATVASFLNAASPNEIVFTKGATDAINLVASSFGASINPGDEIILSEMEHHANIVPWHFLRARGAVLRWVPVLDDGSLDMAAYAAMLGPRTRMVALTAMSNVLGTKTDWQAIVRMAHTFGAKVLLDGCQAVVHGPVDVANLGVDFFCFGGHKLYGPTGIGVLYGREEALAALPPYQGGGEMIEIVTTEMVTYNVPPFRFEAGTPPIAEAVGLAAAIRWLGKIDRVAAHNHEMALHDRAMAHLRSINGVRVFGEAVDKGAILSFAIEGAHPHDVAQVLDRSGVAVRAGHHCAQPLMKRLGVTATARASFALYNTDDEVDAFIEALDKARSFLL